MKLPIPVQPEIPKGVRFWKRGACVPVAMLLSLQLRDEDSVVQGFVQFKTDWQAHTWMLVNGEVFDPTFIQFRRFKGFPIVKRDTNRIIPAPEYRWNAKRAMFDGFWRHRVQLFGIAPEEIGREKLGEWKNA